MESDDLRQRTAVHHHHHHHLEPPELISHLFTSSDSEPCSEPFYYPDIKKKTDEPTPDFVEHERAHNEKEPHKRKGSKKIKKAAHEDGTIEDKQDKKFPETYIVIEFTRSAKKRAIHWLIDKIRASKKNGGAELLVNKEQITLNCEGLTIHVSATDEQLLALADESGFVKKTKSGIMRNFNVSCIDDFLLTDSMKPIDLLTPADKQVAMTNALDSIRASANENFVPGYEGSVSLYKGERIIDACIKAEVIHNYYSPHNIHWVSQIGPKWYKHGCFPVIEMIRDYFGDNFGIYFSFLVFYSMSLVIPSLFGIVLYYIGTTSVPITCIYYVIWTTVFLEVWKRRCSEHAYNWGTISMTYLDKPRVDYHGTLGIDPITGKTAPIYPMWKTYAQMYLISYPVVILAAVLAFFMALSQFWIEDYLKKVVPEDSHLHHIPSIMQSIVVACFSTQFTKLANWLTRLENHRTQMQNDKHRISKLIILEFCNNFVSLFYIAFVLKDIPTLKKQLIVQLTIVQLAQNFQEMILSWIQEKSSTVMCRIWSKIEPMRDIEIFTDEVFEELHLNTFTIKSARVHQSQKERFLPEYNSTFSDYLQIYIQFGYVVLFSSVVPMAALFALVNNVIEIRLDIFKLGWLYKRPFAERAKDTGSWHLAFEILAVISIMTNLGIAYMTTEIREMKPSWTDLDWAMNLMALEHILLILIWCIHRLIPDRPHWVRIALAKADYHSQQALKREAIQRAKFVMFRRFKSVHGPTSPQFNYNRCV